MHPAQAGSTRHRNGDSVTGEARIATMKNKFKDRLVDVLLILFFLIAVSGCAYFIFKIMTRWRIKGLGLARIRATDDSAAVSLRHCR